MNPPVSFQTLAQTAPNPAVGGYPYQLKAKDLDQNFVFATLEIEPTLVTTTTGSGGHKARKLKIPGLPGGDRSVLTAEGGSMSWQNFIPQQPTSGTHVLGAVDGVLQWIATEEC